MAPKPTTVDDYLAAIDNQADKDALVRLRKVIREAAPEAEEVISYQIPLYKQDGHVVGFGAFKNHLSLFATSSDIRNTFAKELEPFTSNHTTIQFTAENPLPDALVTKIVKARLVENLARRKS